MISTDPLSAHIREAFAEFKEEFGDIGHQGILKVALIIVFTHRQEIKKVGIFGNLLSQIPLDFRQCGTEVGDSLVFPLVKVCTEPIYQHVATPVVFVGFLYKEESFLDIITHLSIIRR